LRLSSKRVEVKKNRPTNCGAYPSTLCREFRRNTARRGPTTGCYSAKNAKFKTTERQTLKAKALKFVDCMKQVAVQWLLFNQWIPELISVRGNETGLCPVSHEFLYQWIWACKHPAVPAIYYMPGGLIPRYSYHLRCFPVTSP